MVLEIKHITNKMKQNIVNSVLAITVMMICVSCVIKLESNNVPRKNIEQNNNSLPKITTKKPSQESNIISQFGQDNISNITNIDNINELEILAHQQVNQYRQSRNLPPLELNRVISQQARIHSQNMAQGQLPFSHQGFENRIEAISLAIPYLSAAENVAYNQGYRDPVEKAVEGWIKSPGHHKNMIGNYNLTGIGIAKNSQGEYYFTQIFISNSAK